MLRRCKISRLVVGAAALAVVGCGTQSPSGRSHQTTPSKAKTSSVQREKPVSLIVTNPPLSQLETWINQGVVYGVSIPRSNRPSRTVFLMTKRSFSNTPTTLRHWPPVRFRVVAALNDPQNQMGVTAWGNHFRPAIHWLKIASSVSVAVSIRSSAPSSSLHTSWNPTVESAMHYGGSRTRVPLEAPSPLPSRPHYTQYYLSATTQATKTAYTVTLQYTTTPLPVNSPKINQFPNGAMTLLVGNFGGTEYPTAALAKEALNQGTNGFVPSTSTPVPLGTGIVGHEYPTGQVTWREGRWSLTVANGSLPSDVSLARHIVAYLHQHLLPEMAGSLIVDNAPDGEHTSLKWAAGRIVYQCADYHRALSAIELAIAMTRFP